MMGYRAKYVAYAVAAGAAVVLAVCLRRCRNYTAPPSFDEADTERGLAGLKMCIKSELPSDDDHLYIFLKGGTSELEDWLAERVEKLRAEGYDDMAEEWLRLKMEVGSDMLKVSPSGKFRLVDTWGNAIVYQCPAEDPAFVFRLYSKGMNGRDEGGGGDDIDGSMTYASIADLFQDPVSDGKANGQQRHSLTVVKKDGREYVQYPPDHWADRLRAYRERTRGEAPGGEATPRPTTIPSTKGGE